MGCCVSKSDGRRGHLRRSPAKPPPPPLPPPLRLGPSSQKTHVPDGVQFHAPPEEETVVKEVLSETPVPRRGSPEATEVGNARKVGLDEEATETKILIGKLEEAAEIVSEYSEMCSTASGSLSTATTAVAADKWGCEVTSLDRREPRPDSSRSPVKVLRRRPSPMGAMQPPQSHSRSPARRRPAAGRPELRGDRMRDSSDELRAARPRNVVPKDRSAGRGGGNSRRSSRSPAPAQRLNNNNGIMQGETGLRLPPASDPPELGAHESESNTGIDDSKRVPIEPSDDTDADAISEQAKEESLIDTPHVSLECFIFL